MAKIEHVIVLMLENRSFDHALGWLNLTRPEIDGPSPSYSNPLLIGSPSHVRYPCAPTADYTTQMVLDPPHEFADVTEHLFGTPSPHTGQPATMDGFVQRAAREAAAKNVQVAPGFVMEGFAPGRLPALHHLANEFAICQRWFSSVPGPTWPNRFFAHCGTAGGYLDGKFRLTYNMDTVFERLLKANATAKIYFDDVPQAWMLTKVRDRPSLLAKFETFLKDARNDALPSYSFIEPNYLDPGPIENATDQHPPASMINGDRLIAQVYRALRSSPAWEKSLLLIVWDEHGGFYDHVPPPAAVPPDGSGPGQYQFSFDRLGVRVPAVVVSPWIAKGTVVNTIYEHASIPATLRALFKIAPLTRRDASAASFDSLCDLPKPRNDTPTTLRSEPAPPTTSEDIDLSRAGRRARRPAPKGRPKRSPPPTRFQASMREVAALFERDLAKERRRASAKTRTTSAASAPPASTPRRRAVRPDAIDFRDRLYLPRVASAPPLTLPPSPDLPEALDQGETSACTGYALAAVIDFMLTRARREGSRKVSPRMLYSMARRYDELRGTDADDGSTVRGALKGWFRHGACRYNLWRDDDKRGIDAMPPPATDPAQDWWADALRRPLGAYYRVDTSSISDLQSALVEVGAVYVSAVAHDGWDEGLHVKSTTRVWEIPWIDKKGSDGHAFVLVGYDERGFLLQNSWGLTWGRKGIARIAYDDWLKHAMDAWVVQLGVPTEERQRAAGTTSLSLKASKSDIARDPVVRDHQLGPYIVDSSGGRLSAHGRFRTNVADLADLSGRLLKAFRTAHAMTDDEPVDVALYAHGGLVDEEAAAACAARWVPELFSARVFPVFVMWESDLLDTLAQLLEPKAARATTKVHEWLDRRIELAVARLGTPVWEQMKASASALTTDAQGALRVLFGGSDLLQKTFPKETSRIHLVGHSAGAVVHAHLAAWLVGRGWPVESMTLLAPALRVDAFERLVAPHAGAEIRRVTIFNLDKELEENDPTIPGYRRSVLHLVSSALERGTNVPLIGLERDALSSSYPGVEFVHCPGPRSSAKTHVAFDTDQATLASVIAGIKTPTAPRRA